MRTWSCFNLTDINPKRQLRGHSKSTFTLDSRILTPPFPPPHLFALVRFRAPPPSPPPKVRSVWLELTLCPSISILVKFREKKLLMSTSIFGWTQRVNRWNLYKVDTIGAWQKSILWRSHTCAAPFVEQLLS